VGTPVALLDAILVASPACDSECNTFDGCPRDGLVGSTYGQATDPLPNITVTAYASATMAVVATTESESDGDFDLDVAGGDYVLCVAVAGCPADSATSSCCTSAHAPAQYASYMWEGGQWQIGVP